MNKLIFKLFYSKANILILMAGLLLNSCAISGNAAKEMPNESGANLEFYFCPKDDCGKAYERLINSANSSVHCAFYSINLKNMISSLGRKSKTLDVKVVMDKTNNKGQIKGNGVRFNKGRQLMHNKFCVIDSRIVATGSFNPTSSDNYQNNNNVAVLHSETLAKNYEDEFDELWSGEFGEGKKAKHPVLYFNNMLMENYFCPEDCSLGLHKIINLIKNAKESVKVASFTFTHEAIADELIKADSRGINVTILTETRQRNVMGSQFKRVKEFGLDIRLDGNKYTMHHKFIIIDGKIVITGSPNFTNGGFNKNDENMLIIYDEGIALKFREEFDALFDLSSKN